MTADQWIALLAALAGGALRVGVPYLFVSLGECLTEKSGRINLGLEGVLVLSHSRWSCGGRWRAPASVLWSAWLVTRPTLLVHWGTRSSGYAWAPPWPEVPLPDWAGRR